MRPLIGISGRRWPASRLADHIPAAMHAAQFDLHYSEYPTAVALAGGVPVQIPMDADPVALVDRLDGLVLSGGADVDPATYGAQPEPGLGATEPSRDAFELALLAAALDIGLPVLGICRGAQLLNVHLGGTLQQHVPLEFGAGHPRFDDDRSLRCHAVTTVPGSIVGALYGTTAEVNSLHHQILATLAPSLRATAVADDDVIEAVELPGAPVIAVQWHPEMLEQPDPVFAWLLGQAKAYAAARHGR